MFTRRNKTVASVMESFRRAITDLEQIAKDNMIAATVLLIERKSLNEKLEIIDLEVYQALGTADRLSDLVFGPDRSDE